MKVNAGGLLFRVVEPPDAGSSISIRKKPQISATANRRNSVRRYPGGGDRNFINRTRGSLQHLCMSPEPRNPIPVVDYRIDAGIVSETVFRQNFQRPHGSSCDRKARGPVGP